MPAAASSPLRVLVFGAGFWARFQLPAWRELPDIAIVGIANRTRARAEEVARAFDVPAVYDDFEAAIVELRPDVVDVITDPGTHRAMVELAARHRIDVICQKPLAPTLEDAVAMAAAAEAAGVRLLVHENWRWQAPIRALKDVLVSGEIGTPFRARLQFSSAHPVFDNQPFLRRERRFILMDIGTHILDVARFLLGEFERVSCVTARVNPGIAGEDVATVLLRRDHVACVCELSYASRLEHESFPQTSVLIEATEGSVTLGRDYEVRVTTADGTRGVRHPPRRYAWAEPSHDLVHASIVPCLENLAEALRGEGRAETGVEDNLRTLRLVDAAYRDAAGPAAATASRLVG